MKLAVSGLADFESLRNDEWKLHKTVVRIDSLEISETQNSLFEFYRNNDDIEWFEFQCGGCFFGIKQLRGWMRKRKCVNERHMAVRRSLRAGVTEVLIRFN